MTGLHDAPLALDPLMAAVADPEHGGTAAFVGTTRREASDRPVVALEYEAYEEMAVAEMEAIAREAAEAWGASVAIAHRIGRVEVGEPSVMIAASAGHRPAAFAACRFAIDALKQRAPIWKRAVFADGDAVWADGCAPAAAPAPPA